MDCSNDNRNHPPSLVKGERHLAAAGRVPRPAGLIDDLRKRGGGEGQQLREHFIGSDDGLRTKRTAEFQNPVMKNCRGDL